MKQALPSVVALLDGLEPRRLLAGTIIADPSGTVSLQGSTLMVYGTNDADVITAAVDRRGRIAVTITAPSSGPGLPVVSRIVSGISPAAGDVAKIYVGAEAGDDVVNLSGLSIAVEVHGDTGNDVIYGGNRDDTLFGDSGNDFLSDNRGNDLLVGGAGDDTLRGLRGADTLLGQSGNDRLIEHGDESVVSGGTGTDLATLDGIPDGLTAVENFTGDSAFLPTTATIRRGSGNVIAADTQGTLLLNAVLSSRFRNGLAFDWDMSATRNGVTLSATPFLLNSSVFGTNAPSLDFRRTFDVGPVGGLGSGTLDVNLTSNGLSLFNGVTGLTGSLNTDPAFTTALGNANSTIGTPVFNNGMGFDNTTNFGASPVVPTRGF